MEKALFDLNEKLKYPSDIESKLDSILNRYRNINEQQVERQDFIYQAEVENIQNSYEKLKRAKELAEEQLKAMIYNVLESNEYAFEEFKSIQEVATAHQNFAKTKQFLEMLKAPELQLEGNDLFECFKDVFNEEEFAYEVKNYEVDLTEEEKRLVGLKLNQIKKTGLNFTSTLLNLLENYIENNDEFKGIEKVIDQEETRDQMIRKAKLGVDSEDPILKQFYIEYMKYLHAEPKNLRIKAIKVLKGAISSKFRNLKGQKDFLVKLDFVFTDLKLLKIRNFKFFNFQDFLKEYHKCFKSFIDEKLENVLPEEILGIVEIKGLYYKTIESEFNVVPESLGPKLIENESELLEKFSEIACNKLKDWIDNISTIEIEKFLARDTEISKDEYGKLVSSGFINLLQIIKAQLEPIAYNRKIFIFLTGVIKEKCISFQEKITHSMQSELKKALSGQNLAGFEDYCIVFGNSGLRLAQYISSLPFFQSDEVRELQSIFLVILQSSHEILAEFIVKTSKPALNHLLTDCWIKNNQRQVFIITLHDFLTDYTKAMANHAFLRFVSVLCTKIYSQYLIKLKNEKIILEKSTSEMIKKDIDHYSKLLKEFLDESKFKDVIFPISKLCPLIESVSAELFIVELKSLMLTDKNLEKQLVENIVTRKKNMDNSEKDIIIAKLPELFKEQTTKKNSLLKRLLNK